MEFKEVKVGCLFYDPISQETFKKVNKKEAVMVSGEGDGVTGDEFEPDEQVLINGR